jgi:hypothetical protein
MDKIFDRDGDILDYRFVEGFRRGVWQTLAALADVEWNQGQRVNLIGSGFDGTETEHLGSRLSDQILTFLREHETLIQEIRTRSPHQATPLYLGQEWVNSRNGEGAGLWDCGLGPAGDRLHENAKSYGEISLQVSGEEDQDDPWDLYIHC